MEAILFFKILCSELAQIICQSHIEIPCALLLTKVIALHSISLTQEDQDACQISQSLNITLIEVLGYFLSGTNSALSKLEAVSNQNDCYCGEIEEFKVSNKC